MLHFPQQYCWRDGWLLSLLTMCTASALPPSPHPHLSPLHLSPISKDLCALWSPKCRGRSKGKPFSRMKGVLTSYLPRYSSKSGKVQHLGPWACHLPPCMNPAAEDPWGSHHPGTWLTVWPGLQPVEVRPRRKGHLGKEDSNTALHT